MEEKQEGFALNIGEQDIKEFYRLAYKHGIKPRDVLENFIGDLVDGEKCQGGDEHRLAKEYFDRCYRACAGETFIGHLISFGEEYRYINAMRHIALAEAELEYYANNPEDPEAEDALKEETETKEAAEAEIKALYGEYMEYADGPHESLEEALKTAKEYFDIVG